MRTTLTFNTAGSGSSETVLTSPSAWPGDSIRIFLDFRMRFQAFPGIGLHQNPAYVHDQEATIRSVQGGLV